MSVEKRRSARWTALGLAALAAVWSLGVWPAPVWWRTHWPRETAMQRRSVDPEGLRRRNAPTFVPLSDISPTLQRMVIIAEDSRFRTHHGVDFVEMADALGLERGAGIWGTVRAVWRRRDRLRGASTITQQLAKNFYLSPSRNPFRKVKEAITAVRLELALPKDRILELYLNVVEFGPGIWGVDAAARTYFGASPAALSEEQAAELAATLPFPRSSNPRDHPARMLARRDLILARYHGVPVYIPPLEDVDVLAEDSLKLDALKLDTLKVDTIPLPDTVLPDTVVTDTVRDTIVDTARVDTTRERQTVARNTFLTTVHGFTLLAGAPARLIHQP